MISLEVMSHTAHHMRDGVAIGHGQGAVCLLKGLFLSIGLWVAGIEYAFLFGMVSGFLSLIPFFGPFLGFVGAFTVGMLGEHTFVSSLVRTGIVFGLGELLEGYFLLPKILGDSLGLHPVVVLAVCGGLTYMTRYTWTYSLPTLPSQTCSQRLAIHSAFQYETLHIVVVSSRNDRGLLGVKSARRL